MVPTKCCKQATQVVMHYVVVAHRTEHYPVYSRLWTQRQFGTQIVELTRYGVWPSCCTTRLAGASRFQHGSHFSWDYAYFHCLPLYCSWLHCFMLVICFLVSGVRCFPNITTWVLVVLSTVRHKRRQASRYENTKKERTNDSYFALGTNTSSGSPALKRIENFFVGLRLYLLALLYFSLQYLLMYFK